MGGTSGRLQPFRAARERHKALSPFAFVAGCGYPSHRGTVPRQYLPSRLCTK